MWMMQNRAAFDAWFESAWRHRRASAPGGPAELAEHQHIAKDFIQPDNPYRGLLLYYGLGSGKTATAIAAMEIFTLRTRVVVMLPSTLHLNFAQEIQKFGGHVVRLRQAWKLVEPPAGDVVRLCGAYNVDAALVAKHGGLWLPDDDGTPYDALDQARRDQVRAQVDSTIERTYEFVHYNGVTAASAVLKDRDFFEGKLVVIDEVHGFISRSRSDEGPTRRLYDMLMDARRAKIIALSATPLINEPAELALLANLLRGRVRCVQLQVASHASDAEALRRELEADPSVDEVRVLVGHRRLDVTLLPPGFANVPEMPGTGIVAAVPGEDPGDRRATMRVAGRLRRIVERHGTSVAGVELRDIDLFPAREERFDELFVDAGRGTLKNVAALRRRLGGLVAAYDRRDEFAYPEVSETRVVRVPMTATQTAQYIRQRTTEIAREKRRRKTRDGAADAGAGTKTNTRLLCNFAFPAAIPRPFKSAISNPDDYDAELDEAVATLVARASTFLSASGLPELSPKFAAIVQSVAGAPGPCLVYTNFRRVEGVFLLGAAMEAHGFERLAYDPAGQRLTFRSATAPKYVVYDGAEPDEMRVLLAVFNGDVASLPEGVVAQLRDISGTSSNVRAEWVRAMLITQSGAEGISLKNVRQVHIVEPHWQPVRAQQVVGRAVRANSHAALPPADRRVDVFAYCTIFADTRTIPRALLENDNFMTTDEMILELSQRKARLNAAALDVMRSVSIDPSTSRAPTIPRMGHAYWADVESDVARPPDADARATSIVPYDVRGADGLTVRLGLLTGTPFLCDWEAASRERRVQLVAVARLDARGAPTGMTELEYDTHTAG